MNRETMLQILREVSDKNKVDPVYKDEVGMLSLDELERFANRMMAEAADRIRELEAENETLSNQYDICAQEARCMGDELAALRQQQTFAWNALDSAMVNKEHDREGSLAEAIFALAVDRDALRQQQGEPVGWLYESKHTYWISAIRDKDKSEGVIETPLYREAAPRVPEEIRSGLADLATNDDMDAAGMRQKAMRLYEMIATQSGDES